MRSFAFKNRSIGLALTCILASVELQAATGMYVSNVNSANVNIIDTTTFQVVGTVGVGTGPAGLALDGGTGMYVVNLNSANVNIIDTTTFQVVGTVGVGTGPQALALDGGTGMYVANVSSANVNIIDTTTFQVVGTVGVGAGSQALALDGGTGMYVANRNDNNVNIIDTTTFQVAGTVVVGNGPRAIALDGGTGMYVANFSGGNVNIIDTITRQVAGTVVVGSFPLGIALDGGTGMYVANFSSDNVSIIDTTTFQVVETVGVGDGPRALALDGGTGMYVANSGTFSDSVSIIDTTTFQVVETVDVGGGPFGLAADQLLSPSPPGVVSTNSDGTEVGTLRNAIAQVNAGSTSGVRFEQGIGFISLGSDLSAFTETGISVQGVSASPQGISGSKAFSFPGTAALSDVNFFSTAMGNSGTLSLSNVTLDTSTVENVGQLLVFLNEGLTCINSSVTGSGVVSLSGGILSASGTVNIQQPLNIVSSSTAAVSSGGTLAAAQGLSGTGSLSKTLAGVLSLSGSSSNHTGDLLIQAGELLLNSDLGGGGNLTLQGGDLSSFGTEVSRPVVFSSNGTVEVAALKTLTFSGDVSGSNVLTKTGAGTLIISSDATNLGAIAVNSGTLQIDGTASLPAKPGTLAVGSTGVATINESVSTGNVSGSGTIQVSSGKTFTSCVSGSAALSGTVAGEGTFAKEGTGTLALSGNVAGLNTLNLRDGDVQVNSSNSLPLTGAAGTGTVISGASSTLVINQSMMIGVLSGSGTICIPFGVNVSAVDVSDFSGSLTCGGSLDTGGDPNDPASPIVVNEGTFAAQNGRTGKITLLNGTNLEVDDGFTIFSEIDVNGTGGLIVPPGDPALLKGDFNGDNVEKTGGGIATFDTGTVVTIDNLTISEGTVKVNTEACITNLVIPVSGVLRGIGSIGVTSSCPTATTVLSQGGNVFPGTSIGTLTIKDTYTAEANSSHTFEISPTENSKLVVDGPVTLNDPVTASILTEPGFYLLPFSFNVIESTEPITGTIAEASVSNPFLVASVSKSTNPGHFITITLNSVPLAPLFSGKEGAVVKCIDEISNQFDCNINAAASALTTLTTVSEVGEALLQLQPSALTSLAVVQENHLLYLSSAVDVHLNHLFVRQLQKLKQQDPPSNEKRYLPFFSKAGSSHKAEQSQSGSSSEENKNWNIWVTGLGAHTDQKSASDDVGFRANSAGIVIGADTLLGKYSSAGTLLGYTYGHLNWRQERGKADTNTVYAGGYGRFATARAFVNAALFYGYSFYSVDRKIRFGNFQPVREIAKSDFQGMEGSAHVQTGLDYQCARFGFLPFLRVDYMVIHQNRFTEYGAGVLNLKVASHLADLLSTAAGLKVAYRKIKSDHSLTPFVGLKVIHEERFFGNSEKGAFVCGCSMGDLKGLYPSRTLLGVQGGIDAVFLERHTLSLQYQGKFSHNYSDQSGYLEYSCRL